MGRSSRKSWADAHPDSSRWLPHQRTIAEGMSREAYEAVYGRGEPGQVERISFFWPAGVMSAKLQKGPLLGEERILFLEEMSDSFLPEATDLLDDHVFELFFQRELEGLPEEIREELLAVGEGRLRVALADAVVLFAQRRNEEDYRDRVPLSLLAVATKEGQISTKQIDALFPSYYEFARGQILPQLELFRELDAPSSGQLLSKVYFEFYTSVGDPDGNAHGRVDEIYQAVADTCDRDLLERFGEDQDGRYRRVFNDAFRSILGEGALAPLFRGEMDRREWGPAARRATRIAVGRELERMFLAADGSGADDMEDRLAERIEAFWQDLDGAAPPLEPFRPIFELQGEDIEPLHDNLRTALQKEKKLRSNLSASQLASTLIGYFHHSVSEWITEKDTFAAALSKESERGL